MKFFDNFQQKTNTERSDKSSFQSADWNMSLLSKQKLEEVSIQALSRDFTRANLESGWAFNRAELTNWSGVFTRITTNQCEILYQADLKLMKAFEQIELLNLISDLVAESPN